uniref:Uncharacterized protein n=1 Tax=Anguilla anguilla TaxID=7936 RepID=A0A0E9UDI7_ANGAN
MYEVKSKIQIQNGGSLSDDLSWSALCGNIFSCPLQYS